MEHRKNEAFLILELVRLARLELAQYLYRWNLNPVRLPISPRPHILG
jgi:hypothetical protein